MIVCSSVESNLEAVAYSTPDRAIISTVNRTMLQMGCEDDDIVSYSGFDSFSALLGANSVDFP